MAILFFSSFSLFAQEKPSVAAEMDFICGTEPYSTSLNSPVHSGSVDPNYLNTFETKTFNIFYWRINKSDGSYTQPGWPITPASVKESVARINEHFAPLNICFKLMGMDTINSTAHHTGSSLSSIHNYAKNNGYAKQNAFNIYAPHNLAQGAGQGSYNHTHAAVAAALIASEKILAHELGHNFNLIHTFENNNTRPNPVNCERVTRDPNDSLYNANRRGDKVTDTNAVPNFFREQHNHVGYAIEMAGLGTWDFGRDSIAKREDGFHAMFEANEIEQALVDYGFTNTEIDHLKYNPAVNHAYQDYESCLYMPDSRVNDSNSPFFKDCGGIPYQVTQADIKNMMAYSKSACDLIFTVGQMIRAHEAIEYDKWGDFTPALVANNVDLYIRDTETDIGQEPNIHTNIFWNSTDIWVRNQDDGIAVQEHQNPVYYATSPNHVYIKIGNKGCSTSSGNDQLKLYWAKANTALDWDDYWTGEVVVGTVPMGGELGTLLIPPISPGQEEILQIEWPVPNPQDYVGINPNPWHFCLLARIESNDDPMTFPEGTFITDNVRNNNNIAWKNTTVIEIAPNTASIGAVIGVSNPANVAKRYSLELLADSNESGKPIYQEAEIGIEMDAVLFGAWEKGNKSNANFAETAYEQKMVVTNNNALLDEIELDANEYGTAYITFNFLTEEYTNKQFYIYHVIQRDKATNKIIGGETFEIKKQPRGIFLADAGDDREVDRNESITLQARDINENALYNWYDFNGDLIYTGTDLTVSPEITQQYRLEIISDLDGLKDYDEVAVTVNPYRIISMAPNPVSSQLTVRYMAEGATSGYIMVVNQSTGAANNYIIDTSLSETAIDLTGQPTGLYTLVLVCNGKVQDTQNLAKQ